MLALTFRMGLSATQAGWINGGYVPVQHLIELFGGLMLRGQFKLDVMPYSWYVLMLDKQTRWKMREDEARMILRVARSEAWGNGE